jgi:N-acetylglutamate synthase-like GNAT family acetyltransferase
MIRICKHADVTEIWAIINDGASTYKGTIPTDRWHEPYMSQQELQREIEDGVVFWAFEDDGQILGVMGIQELQDVTLIRHAYVRTSAQRGGIEGKLLSYLRNLARNPLLIGTWADAKWAIGFYEKYGFTLVSREEKERLLRKYWSIPERQIETSVVLASPEWQKANNQASGGAVSGS